MTAKKHLKQRVRERQEKTGERYSTALAHIRGQAPAVEQQVQPEVTEWAKIEGLHCTAFVTEPLWNSERASADRAAWFRAAFARLRSLLLAVEGAPGTHALCSAILRGEPKTVSIPHTIQEVVEARRFMAEVRAGVRGVSRNGRLVAWDVPQPGGDPVTLMALCVVPPVMSEPPRPPILWLFTRDGSSGTLLDGPNSIWAFALAGIGGAGGGTP